MDPEHSDLSPTQEERLDDACDRFEAEWKAGRRPTIEAALDGAPARLRGPLLRALIAVDMAYRRRLGESIDTRDYEARFPEHLDTLRDLFADVTLTHEAPGHRGRRAGRELPTDDRFQTLRSHARGGLGEVFVALDTQLNREVALKRIQGPFAEDPTSRARFVREAEITGNLEHPGIVPVYGLGRGPDGRPHYAMRLIQGDDLRKAVKLFHEADGIPDWRPTWRHPSGTRGKGGQDARGHDQRARSVAFRELLRRFLDVCNAVAYAHGRGVVHRDIKPANIMLGPYGETLLVDWGLAKMVASQGEPVETARPETVHLDAETLTGMAVGTPAYMSPEQASGGGGPLGPASDVYGLGATLYVLLTGRPAFEGPSQEVLERVQKGDFAPPRQVNPQVPPVLEAICLKAMALRPEDRYEGPRALAADVELWLADEPVSVYRDPWRVRMGRWARRHRTATTAAGVAIAVALGALVVAYRRESVINDRLSLVNRRLTTANDQLTKAKAESDRRLDQTLKAIESYYTGVGEEMLLGQKEFAGLRAKLLERPREFYEQLARELEASSGQDERGRSLLMKGRMGLAKIANLLGKWEESGKQYEEAITLGRELVADRPADAEYQVDLAWSIVLLGFCRVSLSDHAGAMALFQEGVEHWSALVDRWPDVVEHSKGLSQAYQNLGHAQRLMGDLKAAEGSLGKSVAIAAGLVASHPDDLDLQSDLALRHYARGIIQRRVGNLRGALSSYNESIALGTKVVAARPRHVADRNELATAFTNRGNVERDLDDLPAAAESHRRAVALFREVVAAEPNMPMYRDRLASTQSNLGNTLMLLDDPRGALEAYQECVALRGKLRGDHPEVPTYASGLAKGLDGLADAQAALGDRDAANVSLGRALEVRRGLVAERPGDPELQNDLAASHDDLGLALRHRGELDAAAASYREAIAIRTRLVAAYPQVIVYRRDLAANHTNLGIALRDGGDAAGAVQEHRRAIDLFSELDKAQPGTPSHLQGLVVSLNNLTFAQADLHDKQGEAETLRRAVAIEEKRVQERPDSLPLRVSLAGFLNNLGVALFALGEDEDAIAAYRQAIEHQRVALEKGPDQPELRSGLAVQHQGLFEALHSLGRAQEALEAIREWAKFVPNDPAELFDAARAFALCAALVDKTTDREAIVIEATRTLKAAIAAGWSDVGRARECPELAPVLEREEVRRLLDELRDKAPPPGS